ncbi:MAG: DUF1848 domain-containing protein [Oscillospiraceae bacterium]
MIVSVSRRTDIPAFYSRWFFERLRAGHCLAANPFNPKQLRKVPLTPEEAAFVFWTKNPAPMLPYLPRLRPYAFYFQCTVTPYGRLLEPHLPEKRVVVQAVQRLAEAVGPERVVWRFDPLLFGGAYTPEWHANEFARLAPVLQRHVAKCVVSFYDPYKSSEKRLAPLGLRPPNRQELWQTAKALAAAAQQLGLRLESCAEPDDLSRLGIFPGACVDTALLQGPLGPVEAKKDKNQRKACGCAASVDIGAYNTCPAGCLYCYATHGSGQRASRFCRGFAGEGPLLGQAKNQDEALKFFSTP